MDINDFAGSISLPDINEGIPDKVTVKELREALEEYARTDKDWKDFCKMKYLSAKEAAGDHLYRLARALLRNNGFYTYRDVVIDSIDGPLPNPDDFD